MKAASVFLSYRRDDTAGTVGRVHDRLRAVLPGTDVFLDVDAIAPGLDFAEAMHAKLAQSDVVLIFIGRAWEAARPDGSRRIDEAGDHVRQEVARALESGSRVIPVLVDRAAMPAAADLPADLAGLPRLNACPLRHASFAADLNALFRTAFGISPAPALSPGRRIVRALLSAMAGFGVAATVLLIAALAHREATGHALDATIGRAGTFALIVLAAAFGVWLARRLYRRSMHSRA